jgi:hypothetical protein
MIQMIVINKNNTYKNNIIFIIFYIIYMWIYR